MNGMIPCRPARVLTILAATGLLQAGNALAVMGVDWATGHSSCLPAADSASAMLGVDLKNPRKSAFTGTLVDDGPALTVIQTITCATTPGNYSVAFDYQNELSPDYAGGSFPDTAFASLYFTDDLANFSIENQVYDHALGLMDIDHQGAFNVNGDIVPSPVMTDWFRFTAEFTSPNQYTVLAFELDNLNGTFGDSIFRVENVSLIPEPGVSALVGLGGLLLIALRARRTRRHSA